MGAVRSRDTGPEMLVRRFLWSNGLRYRVNVSSLPGTPDIALSRHRVAIFVHGCFWHGHAGCSRGKLPKSRLDYWSAKVNSNKKRDVEIKERFEGSGWKHLVVWECQLRTQKASSVALPELLKEIRTISAESGAGLIPRFGNPIL
jgi:DNA mismatch endonuclease (patch repair protein)